jgi:hypothetical protein
VITVRILEAGNVVDECTGPRADGVCPRDDEQGRVACAGRVLDASVSEARWAVRLPVGDAAKRCPLRGFVVEDPDRGRWS